MGQKNSYRPGDAEREFGVDAGTLRIAIRKGNLPAWHGWIKRDDLLKFLESRNPAHTQKSTKEAIKSMKEQKTNGSSPKNEASGFIDAHSLKRLEEFNIDVGVLRNAGQLAELSKAVGQHYAAQERQAKLLQEVGRLADVREVEGFISVVLSELVAEVKKMPTTLDSECAAKADVSGTQAQTILGAAKEHVLTTLESLAKRLPSIAADFQAEQESRVKRRVARKSASVQ